MKLIPKLEHYIYIYNKLCKDYKFDQQSNDNIILLKYNYPANPKGIKKTR